MKNNQTIPAKLIRPLIRKTVLVAITITNIKNPDGIKHIITSHGRVNGTWYGRFNADDFHLNQRNEANSSIMPKLYKKFAEEIMSVNVIYETAIVIIVDIKIPNQGVPNHL